MDKKEMKKLGIVCFAAALAACSNTPVPTDQAKEVSGSQLLTTAYSKAAEDTGKVIIKRDAGQMGSLCNLYVFVDGKPLAKLYPEEKVTIYLAPGRHIVSADPRGACPGGMSEQVTDIVKASTQVFRGSFSSAGDFNLLPTAF